MLIQRDVLFFIHKKSSLQCEISYGSDNSHDAKQYVPILIIISLNSEYVK